MQKLALPRLDVKLLVISVMLSGAGLGVVAFLTADERTWEGLLGLSPGFLTAAAVLVFSMWVVEGLRTRAMLHLMGENLSLSRAVRVNLASGFVAGITPFTTGGPPTQVYLLYRQGIPINMGMAVVATKTLLTFVYFGLTVPVILLRFRAQLGLSPGLNLLVTAAVFLAFMSVGAFLYMAWRPTIIESASTWLISTRPLGYLLRRWDHKTLTKRASREARKFSSSLQLVFGAGNLSGTMLLLVFTFLFWTIFFSLAPLMVLGLGLEVPIMKVITRQVVLFFLISYIPIPGGSGVAEVSFASVFSTLIPSHLLPLFVGGWRFLTYHVTLLAGSLSLATAHR